jgi:hypothetical protein
MGIENLPFTEVDRNPPLIRVDRARLEALIADAIELLDQIDGDPDLENLDPDNEDDEPDHCICGDDGMGPIYVNGFRRWGSEHDGE